MDPKRAKMGFEAPAPPSPLRTAATATALLDPFDMDPDSVPLEDLFDDPADAMPLSQTDNPRPRVRSNPSSHNDSEATESNAAGRGAAAAAGSELRLPALLAWTDSPLQPTVHQRAIHDTIHGHILCEPPLVAIIDTPEFQRLRDLKQLGCTVYVYPGAAHSRFEHCLGVSHLAGSMVDHLMLRDGNRWDIDQRDRLCVKIAGLCHDLGHGPFSHMFELFVNRVRDREGRPHWEHEVASIALFDHLLQNNNIDLSIYGLQLPEDTNFIKLLIMGLKPSAPWPLSVGRPESKRFLLDIVANKRNGIDVDKLDYFMRDAISALGSPPIGCDIKRLISASRAMQVEGQTQVCFEEKMALGIFDIFRLRAWLHKYVYQHHTVKIVEEMICDIFTTANDHFHALHNAAGSRCRLSDAVDDMFAFAHLGDWILNAIEASVDEALLPAREILCRLRSRNLYAVVGQPISLLSPELRRLTEDDVRRQIVQQLDLDAAYQQHLRAVQERQLLSPALQEAPLSREALRAQLEADLVVHFVSINYGSRNANGEADNPVTHVRFFNPKLNPEVTVRISEQRMPMLFMPQAFEEKLLYVYTRRDESHAALEQAQRAWRHGFEAAKTPGGRQIMSAVTPVVANNPASPSKAATRLARHASGNGLPRMSAQNSPLRGSSGPAAPQQGQQTQMQQQQQVQPPPPPPPAI